MLDTDKRKTTPLDIHIGRRLRARRELAGLSQEYVANKTRLTFQQIQKYERGTNRISASRLYELAKILKTPITWFYARYSEDDADLLLRDDYADPLARKDVLALARKYVMLTERNPACKKTIHAVLDTLLKNE